MEMDDDVIRIPVADSLLGSYPTCGKSIWSSYLESISPDPNYEGYYELLFKCIECKELINCVDIIPF